MPLLNLRHQGEGKKKGEEEISKFEEKEDTDIKGGDALLQLVLLHIV